MSHFHNSCIVGLFFPLPTVTLNSKEEKLHYACAKFKKRGLELEKQSDSQWDEPCCDDRKLQGII